MLKKYLAIGLFCLGTCLAASEAGNAASTPARFGSYSGIIPQKDIEGLFLGQEKEIIIRFPHYAGFYRLNNTFTLLIKKGQMHSRILDKHLIQAVAKVYSYNHKAGFSESVNTALAKYSILDLEQYNYLILDSGNLGYGSLLSGTAFDITNNKLAIMFDRPENVPKIQALLHKLNIPEDAYTISYAKFTLGTDPPAPTPSSPIP